MFSYFLKNRLRNRSFIFWSLMFPLALMTCFKVAFGNLSTAESIDTLNMAVINSSSNAIYSEGFYELVDNLTEEETNGDAALFELHEYDSEDEVREAILNEELDFAFRINDDDIEVLVPRTYSEMSLAVSKSVADAYMSNFSLIMAAFEKDPVAAMELIDNLGEDIDFIDAKTSDFIDESPNPYIWYYYSSFIMGIFFNSMNGVEMLEYIKADCGTKATRVSISPAKKWKLILSAYSACLSIGLVINVIQLFIMKYFFEIPLGTDIFKLITLVIGCNVFSLAFGVVCGCLMKGPIESRGNKITGIIMTSVFLSGEMVVQLPGYIEEHLPVLNDINPATVMNMALFRLSYSTGDFDFYSNMAKIVILAVICLVISVVILRREKYASV